MLLLDSYTPRSLKSNIRYQNQISNLTAYCLQLLSRGSAVAEARTKNRTHKTNPVWGGAATMWRRGCLFLVVRWLIQPKRPTSDTPYARRVLSRELSAIAPVQEGHRGAPKGDSNKMTTQKTQTRPTRHARPTPPHPKPTNPTKHRHTRAQRSESTLFAHLLLRVIFLRRKQDTSR